MEFSVIIPAFNEKLLDVLFAIKQIDRGFEPSEYLVMENGTRKLAEIRNYDHDRIRYHQNDKRALGWALREGLKGAISNSAVFLPADMAYDLSFVSQALPLLDSYPLIIGSKAHMDSKVSRPPIRNAISNLYNSTLWMLYDHYNHPWPLDITGAKAYNLKRIRKYLDSCPSDGIWFEVQLVKEILKDDGIVKEIPAKVHDLRVAHFA